MAKSEPSRGLFAVRGIAVVMALVFFLSFPTNSAAYAVLAHEAIIDSVWNTDLRPLLLKRFPNATPEEIKQAHGYAYGGAIIQDMGYYPHGSFFFRAWWSRRHSANRRSQSTRTFTGWRGGGACHPGKMSNRRSAI